MWKNNIKHVNKMWGENQNKRTKTNKDKRGYTYPQTKSEQKIKYGLLETLNKLYTYPHP